jgi:hypothetical protein
MHNFDVVRSGSERKLSWAGKANPTSMLNLYHMLLLFGSLRNIWDGNWENYYSTSYLGMQLEQIHLLQSLKELMEKLIREYPEILELHQQPKKYERYPGFRIYPNFASVKFAVPKVAISGIQVNCELSRDGTRLQATDTEAFHFFICYHGRRNEYFVTELVPIAPGHGQGQLVL